MSNLTRKLTLTAVAALAGIASLGIAPASPASAMPKEEFKWLCNYTGGDYKSMGKGSCTYSDGTVIINNPNEP